ncbi:MAG: dicarboxylate/amino acid:cation symporter, partial [Flavobacteriales bacterium]
MKKLALHWKIIIGMVLGIVLGFVMNSISGGKEIVTDWIAPFGKIFINLLKLIAVPLILASLIKGVSDLKDISKIKSMGLRTIGIYIGTTLIAIIIGLSIVNLVQPGVGMSPETLENIKTTFQGDADLMIGKAKMTQEAGPLQALVDIFPSNIFQSFASASMLQIIFFALFVGICLLLIPEEKAKPLISFFDSLNEVVMKMVDLIMLFAPYAVLALMANVIIAFDDTTILIKLLGYAACVVVGLFLMICFYMILVKVFAKKSPFWFLKQLSPAQLLAFSTSSSAATLPVTMERVEEHLGVDKEV